MIEKEILTSLIYNEEYARKTLPFLKTEYFEEHVSQVIFEEISKYIHEYNVLPPKQALMITLEESDQVNEETLKEGKKFLRSISEPEVHEEWLIDQTEEFCQYRAIFNAIKDSIGIIEGNDKKRDKGLIPQLLQDALAVTFDASVGHDYIEDAEARYEFYHKKEHKVSTGIELIDRITKGGFSKKALACLVAGTGAGKSLVMCSMAANNFKDGKNVLYITAELSEEMVGERIDANLLDLTLDELKTIPKKTYDNKISRVKEKYLGKLIVKEYPTSTANSNHFRHLLTELKLKKGFIPDIIYIDYLNICASSRIKNMAMTNSYTYVKSIAEEFRALAVEFEVPIVTATQLNREGIGSSDIEMTNTSESIGLVFTLDLMLALYTNEELERDGHLLIKQLKNRYGDLNYYRKFNVGIERDKMKIYNLDNPTDGMSDDTPVMNNTAFGERQLDMDGFK